MSDSTRTHLLLVLCTCPDSNSADQIACSLVKERLAACVTQLPQGRSTYVWNDQLVTAQEIQLVIKTTNDKHAALLHRLTQLHPYDVPEAIALPINAASPDYLNWVMQSTRSNDSAS